MIEGNFRRAPGYPWLRVRLALIRDTVRKTVPDPAAREAEARMVADLRRLVEVSPHLLADIGFEEQRPDASGARVWARGPLRVVLDA